jgi:hypothetical protein
MIKIISIIALTFVVTGCGSTRQVSELRPQYCYTNQSIEVENGSNISSKTRVECTDDRTKQLFQARSGISNNCMEFYYAMPLNGQMVQRRGYVCQKFSGSSEVFNPIQYR